MHKICNHAWMTKELCLKIAYLFNFAIKNLSFIPILLLKINLCQQHFNLVYAFMESKATEAYRSVFEFLRDTLAPRFRPKNGFSDFEAAIISAALDTYQPTGLLMTGCWFHFCYVSTQFTHIFTFYLNFGTLKIV